MISDDLLLNFFPILILFHMAQNLPGLTKYTFEQGSLPRQKEIKVQAGEIILDIFYWKLCLTLNCHLQ